MNQRLLDEVKKSGGDLILSKNGVIYSMNPPETMFGFTYHAHMIPPFKPVSMLMLGYGSGTVAHLTRLIWGQSVKVTGIDIEQYDRSYVEYKMKTQDAWEYIKDCTGLFKTKYEYICVDIWNGLVVPEFVFEIEFAVRLKEMCKRMVSINVLRSDMKRLNELMVNYGGFVFERGDMVENNVVMWWSQEDKK